MSESWTVVRSVSDEGYSMALGLEVGDEGSFVLWGAGSSDVLEREVDRASETFDGSDVVAREEDDLLSSSDEIRDESY